MTKLDIWRLHPHGIKIQPAEKTLNNTANEAGVKFCKPFTHANSIGWWVFPPLDIDILWKGGREFEHNLIGPSTFASTVSVEHGLVHSLLTDTDYHRIEKNSKEEFSPEKWCPTQGGRTKFTWGGVEEGVVQIWTGCIFQTPPGWCLQIRSPINVKDQYKIRIMEGILETDWLQYDIWINMVFLEEGQWVKLRRNNWPPLAQIIPIRRESIEKWQIADQIVNRDTPEANKVFEFWLDYNHKKFGMGGKQYLAENRTKDGTAYHKMRKEYMEEGVVYPIKRKNNTQTTSS